MTIAVPAVVASMLSGRLEVGAAEQAFPLVTVDAEGFPHVCLLSRNELDVDAGQLCAVVASRRTQANLERSGTATLLAVEGTTAHYVKLRMVGRVPDAVLRVQFEVVEHIEDSLGIALTPMSFTVPADLATLEAAQRRRRADRT